MSKNIIGMLVVLLIIALGLCSLWFWVHGIILSFQAHPATGIVFLIIEPLPWLVGGVDILLDYNFAEAATSWFINK